jgi:hypothetical protein
VRNDRDGRSDEMAERLSVVNSRLGWGDPRGGLWFIGIEEAGSYTRDKVDAIAARKDRSHECRLEDKTTKPSHVDDKTAKIVSELNGCSSWEATGTKRCGDVEGECLIIEKARSKGR